MSKIALIIPYFGKLPNYFQLWLQSAGYNTQIDYLLFTDCDLEGYYIPPNVITTFMDFEEVKRRAAKIFDFEITLHNPYKLCDYRPLYGIMFSEFLKKYDFWGHCDPDVTWGDLSKYITRERLEKYDRIYRRGHLCIYRNSEKINYAPIQKLVGSKISYQDVYRHRYSAHYDEGTLIETLIQQQDGRCWDEDDFADISYFYKQFVLVKHDKLCETVAAFRWKEGTLVGLGIDGDLEKEKEYSYVHLQKRKMDYESDGLKSDFLIIPNEFIPYTIKWKELAPKWLQNNSTFEKQAKQRNRLNQMKNVREGALIFRWKKLIEKLER